MADTATKPPRAPRIDPEREIAALASLKDAYARECLEDPDFVIDLAEGETSLLEAIDALAHADLIDESLIAGVEKAEEALALRKQRFSARRQARRGIIEQALLILEVKKLERPVATLTIAERAGKVEIDDESAIPARFWLAGDPKLDRKALKAAMDAGEAVHGAHISNGFASLTIRRR